MSDEQVGPWEVEPDYVLGARGEGRKTWRVYSVRPDATRQEIAYDVRTEASARLIAAAPDLLDALRHVGVQGHRFRSVAAEGCPGCIAALKAIASAAGGAS